jgi:CBS domain-containing protein
MKKSLVKDWMTNNPIQISPDMSLPKAHKTMKDFSIRRLPVVEEEGLVGIVTLGDVREAGPSDATSLSIYELNYMLANLAISDVMTKDPITVSSSTTLHDTAKIMLEKKLGGLPVIDDGRLVGIITESDIFRAVMEIFE